MSAIGTSAALCPECEGSVKAGPEVRQNEIVECPDCRSELEVVGLDPLTLALAPEVEEDWGE
jgi:alpha-aminoadipate carrier protein LysW